MLEKLLIRHCAPTLASLKTANMFTYTYFCEKEFNDDFSVLNNKLNKLGIKLNILKNSNKSALIYVYREKSLVNDLEYSGVLDILQKYGYGDTKVENALELLKERIASCKDFPHEIGLFLGYPLGDVIGFIENKGQNCKCVGCWKVYCNECEAQSKFAKFKKCTSTYVRLWDSGKSIIDLTVA